MPRTYTCQVCGGTFESGWTEEEAIAEFVENFAHHPLTQEQFDDVGSVCDDCHQKFMEWMKNGGYEQIWGEGNAPRQT